MTQPLARAVPRTAESVARDVRLGAAARAELGKALRANDLRKLADADAELNARFVQVNEALSQQDKAAATWQEAHAAATKLWEAHLAEFGKLHPEA